MIDKGKYASHGTFIKKLAQSNFPKGNKPQLAIIHPIPETKPRQVKPNEQIKDMKVNSRTFSAKFKYQQLQDRQPIGSDLSQPFLYIQQVVKKQTVDKQFQNKKYQPFITSKSVKNKVSNTKPQIQIPQGYSSLFQYEQDKKNTANSLFSKLLQNGIENIKDMYLLWNCKSKKNPQLDIKEEQFIDFFKEILPSKISQKQLKHFFNLYRKKISGKQQDLLKIISIKALSYNYQKYKKSQIQVSNILSEKASKERYVVIKEYLHRFDTNYPELKKAVQNIKQYQQNLKKGFKQLYGSYQNPYTEQIFRLKKQLQKPIIKYDKFKKQQLHNKINQYEMVNSKMYNRITHQYESFLQNYEKAVLKSHDLFFTKRTLVKLLLPIIKQHPTLTKQLINNAIQMQQQKKQQYLQCLSNLVIEIDNDKKNLNQNYFTLEEIVNIILMRNKKKGYKADYTEQFLLYSSKKLVKQIKKQFLIKYEFSINSQFPCDQQIEMSILHTCFQMQCTKILFKNQIWNQILQFIPDVDKQSKYHQTTIQSNMCLEFIRRYFQKLDQRIQIQNKKSKQISLMSQGIGMQEFGLASQVIEGVLNQVQDIIQDQQEEADKVVSLQKKKVAFADVVDTALNQNNFPQKYRTQEEIKKQKQAQMIKNIVKSIHLYATQQNQKSKQSNVIQASSYKQTQKVSNLQDNTNLAKSLYVSEGFNKLPQGMNTNSFDIRYYQKFKKQEQLHRNLEPEVIRMGSSMLLSNLPNVDEIVSNDPLRISRFLMTNIDKGVKQSNKVLHEKSLQKNIKEGVNHNYYQDKIKLQNKPTIFDSQGKSKYSVLLPVGYYESFVAAENIPDKQKWYLRPHHVETLTENPLSKKDNIIHTEYQSKLDKIPLKKRPDEYVIEQNVKRKGQLIDSLQDRINALKKDLQNAQRGTKAVGAKVPVSLVNNYLQKLVDQKQDKDLQIAAFQGVLYDLRRKQRQLLNQFRNQQSYAQGEPEKKWWQRKDKLFNNELRKDRQLVSDSLKSEPKHHQYVQKLKNSQIY